MFFAGDPKKIPTEQLFYRDLKCFLAEREGFEPPEAHTSTVFKTAAIDHSAISPWSFFKSCAKIELIF